MSVYLEQSDEVGGLPRLAYTRVEAARILGISLPTLDRLVARGLLHPSRATRRPIFSHKELERFLAETTASIRTPLPS